MGSARPPAGHSGWRWSGHHRPVDEGWPEHESRPGRRWPDRREDRREGRRWPGRRWPGGRWRHDRPPAWSHGVALAVVIALVQMIGTTLTARDQVAVLDPLGYGLLATSALTLALRQRLPVVAFGLAGGLTLAYQALDYPRGPTFVAVIIAAVVAVKAGHRYPVWALTAAGYVGWLVLLAPPLTRAAGLAAGIVAILLAAEWARAAVVHRARAVQVQREQARARTEQQRRRASEERLRIAQELHDVLGHHLSLINVQAGVGLHLMDTRPEQARAALGTIKQASAEALREVRSVLATLHPTGAAAPRTPAPGLERIAGLTVDAGLPVRIAVTGQPRPVPAELDRAAYRIVQEALTNVRRHAGAGASAAVGIGYGDEELTVRIEDDGGAAGTPPEVTEGSGIGGMRERAAALGGTLAAGPQPGGGFVVVARFPLPPPAPASPEASGSSPESPPAAPEEQP